MKQIISLAEKKIMVTGASSGMGRATAILLSQIGAKVVLVGRNESKLHETIAGMEEPEKHICFSQDLSVLEEIEPLVKQAVRQDGVKLNGLVHCAGAAHTVPLPLMNYEKQDADMRLNYYAFIELIKHISKRKYCGESCSFVGISSVAAFRGEKCQTIYSATKAAMDAAVITLSKELADKGMRINSIRPGSIRTDMLKKFAEQIGLESVDVLNERQRFGLGKPEDVANLAAFLLSPAAGFITGQNIAIDGGGPKSEWF